MKIFQLFACTVFLCSTSAAIAQPQIDSLTVDLPAGRLFAHGNFMSTQGSISIDGITQPTLSWSSTLVSSHLPDTGKGSCGPVLITDASGISEERNLTLFLASYSHEHSERHSIPVFSSESAELQVRMDLHALLVSGQSQSLHRVDSQSRVVLRSYYGSQWSPEYGYDTEWITIGDLKAQYQTEYSAGYRGVTRLAIPSRELRFHISEIRGINSTARGSLNSRTSLETAEPFSIVYNLDRFFNPVLFDTSFSSFQGAYQDQYKVHGSISFPPPAKVIALSLTLTLLPVIEPQAKVVKLLWIRDTNFVSYNVQVAKDPEFTLLVKQTDVGDTSLLFEISHAEKYFWRVQGRNRYGLSEWSHSESFMFNILDVEEIDAPQKTTFTSSWVRYHIDSNEVVTFRISDILGRAYLVEEASGSGQIELSRFPRPLVIQWDEDGRSQMKLIP